MSETKPLEWKLPNEVKFFLKFNLNKNKQIIIFSLQILRLQRLKQKKKALQARLIRPSGTFSQEETTTTLNAIPAAKRKNPFSK